MRKLINFESRAGTSKSKRGVIATELGDYETKILGSESVRKFRKLLEYRQKRLKYLK